MGRGGVAILELISAELNAEFPTPGRRAAENVDICLVHFEPAGRPQRASSPVVD